MIFCQQMSLSLFPSSVSIFQQSLENWLQIWKLRVPSFNSSILSSLCDVDNKSRRGNGFTRHASEYHALAASKLKILSGSTGKTSQTLALSAESEDVADVVHLALGLK